MEWWVNVFYRSDDYARVWHVEEQTLLLCVIFWSIVTSAKEKYFPIFFNFELFLFLLSFFFLFSVFSYNRTDWSLPSVHSSHSPTSLPPLPDLRLFNFTSGKSRHPRDVKQVCSNARPCFWILLMHAYIFYLYLFVCLHLESKL